jgi:hypothetical protein
MWRTETVNNQPGAGSSVWEHQSCTKEFDIKAMRRLPELQMTYNLVVKRLTVAAASLNLVVSASILLKLP